MKRAFPALLALLCATLALLIATSSSPLYAANFWTDTNIYFTIGRGMTRGLLPYRDLFDHKGPLLFMLYALGAAISDTSFIGVFILEALSLAAAEHLVSAGAKAIVVACNTATSAAIGLLRQTYPDIPVIGTEPALKPAVEKYPGGRILVMATPMTIRQEKFQALKHQFDDQAQIIGLPCEGLMEFVERGELRGSAVEAYLAEKLAPYLREPVDGIVLGCTHYPFLTGAIRRIVGPGPEIMDGSHGVAMQLARKLAENGMLRSSDAPGTAVFENSLDEPEILALSRALFRYQDE